MCASPSSAFGWVGTLLVNVGFCILIGWGAAAAWPLGFCLCAAYTVFLFGLANRLHQREREPPSASQENLVSDEAAAEEDVEQDNTGAVMVPGSNRDGENEVSTTTTNVPVLVSLVYGLAVLSLGVTGFFIPVNLFPNCRASDDDNPWGGQWTWKANLTGIPDELHEWANREADYQLDTANSFGYVATTGITLFSGFSSDQQGQYYLWSTSPAAAPQKHGDFEDPRNFMSVSNSTVCFSSSSSSSSSSQSQLLRLPPSPMSINIYCSDGTSFRPAIDTTKTGLGGELFDFVLRDGTLWYKRFPTGYGEWGHLVFSLDPDSMVVSLHSQRVNSKKNKKGCPSPTAFLRIQAVVALFLTALPVALASMGLWYKKQIPSMGFMTYVGLTFIFASLYAASAPISFLRDGALFKWWFSISGLIWLLGLSFVLVAADTFLPSPRNKGPVQWGLVVGGLAFLSGMVAVFLFDCDHFELLHWILLNVLAFIPLIILGAATNTTFLMILGAFGFLMDAGRVAEYVGDHTNYNVPLQFLVFSLAGFVVVAIGMLLNKYQHFIQEWAVAFVQYVMNSRSREDGSRNVLQEALLEDAAPLVGEEDTPLVGEDGTPLVGAAASSENT